MIPLEKIIVLNQIPLFSPLNTEEIRLIAEIAVEDYRRAGEALFTKGEEGGRMYIVISGRFELYNPSGGTGIAHVWCKFGNWRDYIVRSGPEAFQCALHSRQRIVDDRATRFGDLDPPGTGYCD